jgi:hypothetical protein
MIWARMLAYITGTVDQELLLRNEYLAAENRILRAQIKGRLLLSDAEKLRWLRSATGPSKTALRLVMERCCTSLRSEQSRRTLIGSAIPRIVHERFPANSWTESPIKL